MLIHRIKQTNLLSFGPDTPELELRPLNVLIGPNGAGKSNLLEGVSVLQSTSRDMAETVRSGGGIHDWIWRGGPGSSSAKINVIIENHKGQQNLRYELGFAERGQRFELIRERIENEHAYEKHDNPYLYYEQQHGRATLNYKDGTQRQLRPEEVDPEQSILAQRKDPDHYPELTYLGNVLGRIRLYREWSFGRNTPPRRPQQADLPNDFLREDGQNLGLVLNKLRREPKVKRRILDALRKLYDGITDFEIIIESGTFQVFLQEGDITIPATRLSDGTLRYLCLLAILCHPTPAPLVCIEEPELGLHPDILPTLSELLLEASERGQIIVTTHSEVLVDALTATPENVITCEKHAGQTEMRRLKEEELADWLNKYSLGELWLKGEIGGNRW